VIVLVIAIITVLITLGVVKLLNKQQDSTTVQDRQSIRLVGNSQQLAVALVGTGERREVKLIDTQTLIVRDATRGQGTALMSAISPNGGILATILDSPDGPIVSVVRVQGGKPVILRASTLLEAGEQAGFSRFVSCRWSSISWSSDSSRFLVFGCHKDESALVIVDATAPLEAVTLANTRAVQEIPRQAIWLNNHEILFTQMNDAADKSRLMKISADDTEALPILVYGE